MQRDRHREMVHLLCRAFHGRTNLQLLGAVVNRVDPAARSLRPDSGVFFGEASASPRDGISGERKHMKAQVFGLRVAGTIFSLVAIVHLLRLLTNTSVVIGGWTLPVVTSLGGALFTGALAFWFWWLSRPIRATPPRGTHA